MRTLVTASAHFAATDDGHLWTANAALSHRFWSRYLEAYDEVVLAVRSQPVREPPQGWNRATGPGVSAVPLPEFYGVAGYVKSWWRLRAELGRAVAGAEAIHLRVPCMIGDVAWHALERGRPYGLEVLTDPYDVFGPGVVEHPLRRLLRWKVPHTLRRQCAAAAAVSYVTEAALQRRYPAGPHTVSIHFSDVELPEEAFVAEPRPERPVGSPFKLVFVGHLDQLLKAPDVLIESVAMCAERGLDVRLAIVGAGRHLAALRRLADQLGAGERVEFCGQLAAGEDIRAQLDRADVFVLPSKAEGLPKAILEAMARALPCLCTPVAGIPELLHSEDLVTPGDANELAHRIAEVAASPPRLAAMSARNLAKAKSYGERALRPKRLEFYRHVRDRTSAWFERGRARSERKRHSPDGRRKESRSS